MYLPVIQGGWGEICPPWCMKLPGVLQSEINFSSFSRCQFMCQNRLFFCYYYVCGGSSYICILKAVFRSRSHKESKLSLTPELELVFEASAPALGQTNVVYFTIIHLEQDQASDLN